MSLIKSIIDFYVVVSEIDNDAYCVCTHDFSLCTQRKFGTQRTMYAVKISGTQTVFGFMRTQKIQTLKLSENDNFSTSFVWLLCQQWKSSYNINVAFARSLLNIMRYLHVLSVQFLGQTNILPKIYS